MTTRAKKKKIETTYRRIKTETKTAGVIYAALQGLTDLDTVVAISKNLKIIEETEKEYRDALDIFKREHVVTDENNEFKTYIEEESGKRRYVYKNDDGEQELLKKQNALLDKEIEVEFFILKKSVLSSKKILAQIPPAAWMAFEEIIK